jgi:hypothetical protein
MICRGRRIQGKFWEEIGYAIVREIAENYSLRCISRLCKSKRQVLHPWSSSLHPVQSVCIALVAIELGICTHCIPNATQPSWLFSP